jgi:hypothetical protein
MPRELKSSDKNEFSIFDKFSGENILLFYRTPTTKEYIEYRVALINLATTQAEPAEITKTQIEWAKKIMTGFRTGDFMVGGKPISSNEKDKNYYQGWRGLLEETATDILLLLTHNILEESCYAIKTVRKA